MSINSVRVVYSWNQNARLERIRVKGSKHFPQMS